MGLFNTCRSNRVPLCGRGQFVFLSEPRSDERACREYGSDKRRRRSPKTRGPTGRSIFGPDVVAPQSHSPAMLHRRASPRSQILASQLYRVYRDRPLVKGTERFDFSRQLLSNRNCYSKTAEWIDFVLLEIFSTT